MSDGAGEPSAPDRRLVTRQLDREPRGSWRVATRCTHGFPQVIATFPTLPDGTLFPTLFWLSCPWLRDVLRAEESRGGTDAWAARAAADPVLARALRTADAAYRAARAEEARGDDPCRGSGIAGQRDPLAVKCLHAHVAAALGGVPDPVGARLLDVHGAECADRRCTRLGDDPASPADGPALVESRP